MALDYRDLSDMESSLRAIERDVGFVEAAVKSIDTEIETVNEKLGRAIELQIVTNVKLDKVIDLLRRIADERPWPDGKPWPEDDQRRW